jgi:hypothetical protein
VGYTVSATVKSEETYKTEKTMSYRNVVTAVMTTSPIESHPSTEIVARVLDSIRFHLGDIEVLLLCDGIRVPEHEYRRERYEAYKLKMRDRPDIRMMTWSDSIQQVRMVREALPTVKTPLILYIEHDFTLTLDPIDWEGIINALQQERVNVVRLHNGDEIHPLHQHLMEGMFEGADGHHGGVKVREPEIICGVPMIRTVQFWGAPHLARTDWYREQLNKLAPDAYAEIEPALYGPISYLPWEQFKIAIYAPSEPSMRRSQHLGGRGHDNDDPKREMRF